MRTSMAPPARTHDAFATKPIELQPLLERIGTLLHLNWIREPLPSSDRSCDQRHHRATDQRIAPAGDEALASGDRSRHHFDDLYRLGRIGHVRGIEAKLREMELEDPANEAVAAQLRVW